MSDKIFDLEQSIMNCWNVVEDIKLLSEAVQDRPKPFTEDELSNLLTGLETLYQLKFDKMWGLFEEVCKEYHTYRKIAQNASIKNEGE